MKAESHQSELKSTPDIRLVAETLQKLSKKAGLPPTEREAMLERCLETARKVDWPGLLESLEHALKEVRESISADSERKREQVLQVTEQAGLAVRRYSDCDRIGPVRVTHKGPATSVLFAKLRLESFSEPRGPKAAERIVARIKDILESPFDTAAFCQGFRVLADWAASRRIELLSDKTEPQAGALFSLLV